MKVGLSIIQTPYTVDPATLAQKAEELGFESIWLGEHPIIPVHYQTWYPLTEDGRLPAYYSQICDPFIGLACAAAVTKKIKLATGICLVAERTPLLLAKEVATLDYYSGGRVILGVGGGFLKEETEIMSADFSRRWLRVRESVQAMREIWTKEEAEFHGQIIDFPPVRCEPKPVQKPYPPVLVGAVGEKALKRVARWADGWCPVAFFPPQQLREDLRTLRSLTEAAGRDPDKLDITVYLGVTAASPMADMIKQFEEAGAQRMVLALGRSEGPLAFRDYEFSGFAPKEAEATLERLADKSLARLT